MEENKYANFKKDHIMKIKERLVAAREDYIKVHKLKSLSCNKLHELLSEIYGKENTPSIPTLTSIFDLNRAPADISVTFIVQLSKFFNKSLSYILALPDENDAYSPLENMDYGTDTSPVTDPHYHGNFVCYMLKNAYTPEDIKNERKTDTLRDIDTIMKADLTITYENNVSTANMVIHNTRKEYDNQIQEFDTKLSGNAVLFNTTQNIMINFISSHNRPYTMMFDYEHFENGPVYFREAAILTNSGGKRKLPQFFKAIIVRKDIDPCDYDFVRGLLSLNVSNVIISKAKFDKLCETNELIERFRKEFEAYLKLKERTFYTIPESIFEMNLETSMNFDAFKKAILILRNHSYSLAQLEIGHDHDANTIAKTLQQYELPEVQNAIR